MTTTDRIFPDSNPIVELRQVPKTLALGREYDDGVAEWLNGVVVYSPPSFMADTRGTWLIAYAQDGDDLPQVKYLGGPPTLDERQARADGLIVFWAQPGNWVYKRFDGTQCGGTADRILEELVHSGLRGPASGAVDPVIGAAVVHLGLPILPALPCPTCGGKRWLRAPAPYDEVLPGRSCPDCNGSGVWTPPDSATRNA